jgi:hypothetical protein
MMKDAMFRRILYLKSTEKSMLMKKTLYTMCA